MPRKKSVSGRSRGVNAVDRVMIEAERINRQLNRLEKAGYFGKYKSKELLEFVSRRPSLQLTRSRRSKRHAIRVIRARLTEPEARLVTNKFKEISKSKAFSKIGIQNINKKIRARISKTLSEELGRKITEPELERFFDILDYKEKAQQDSILDKIDPSLFQRLVNIAIKERRSENSWEQLLGDYVEINNDYYRKEAKELYEQFVRPYL